jgi:hypothetical protein
MSDTSLILHVKGTEETRELPKQVVRAAIAQGQLSRSQLIWSPVHNAWKQVRELPHLWPSQKLAPAPTPRVQTGAMPKITGPVPKPRVGVQSGPVPRVSAQPAVAAATPRVQAAGVPAVAVKAKASADRHKVEEEKDGAHPLMWVCIGLTVLILLTVGVNYFLISRPLSARLARTAYARDGVYAHLGAFVQPNALVIHMSSSAVGRDELPDYLIALAHSTPNAAFSDDPFERVSLTTGLMGQYSFSGYGWKELGDMAGESADQKKAFILDQLGDAAGQSLVPADPKLTEGQIQAEREKVWDDFVAVFSHP